MRRRAASVDDEAAGTPETEFPVAAENAFSMRDGDVGPRRAADGAAVFADEAQPFPSFFRKKQKAGIAGKFFRDEAATREKNVEQRVQRAARERGVSRKVWGEAGHCGRSRKKPGARAFVEPFFFFGDAAFSNALFIRKARGASF